MARRGKSAYSSTCIGNSSACRWSLGVKGTR
jgi:hypothetical protein